MLVLVLYGCCSDGWRQGWCVMVMVVGGGGGSVSSLFCQMAMVELYDSCGGAWRQWCLVFVAVLVVYSGWW